MSIIQVLTSNDGITSRYIISTVHFPLFAMERATVVVVGGLIRRAELLLRSWSDFKGFVLLSTKAAFVNGCGLERLRNGLYVTVMELCWFNSACRLRKRETPPSPSVTWLLFVRIDLSRFVNYEIHFNLRSRVLSKICSDCSNELKYFDSILFAQLLVIFSILLYSLHEIKNIFSFTRKIFKEQKIQLVTKQLTIVIVIRLDLRNTVK